MLDLSSKNPLIFVYAWEYECCGDLIAVNHVHDLTVTAASDDTWGRVAGKPITLVAEHHGPAEPMAHIRARIENLWEAREKYDRSGPKLERVPGSAVLNPVPIMDRRPADHPGLEMAGWILGVTILEMLPPHPDEIPYGMSSHRQPR